MPGRKKALHITLAPGVGELLGQRLRAEREAARITQETLAHTAGISTMQVQRIERGVTNPCMGTLYAIGDTLHIDLPDLLGEVHIEAKARFGRTIIRRCDAP